MNYRSKLTFGPPPHFCNDTNNSIKSCAGILWIVIMQTKLALKYRAFTGQNDYDLIKFIYLISKSEWMQNGWEQHKLQEKVRDVIISPNNSFAFELWSNNIKTLEWVILIAWKKTIQTRLTFKINSGYNISKIVFLISNVTLLKTDSCANILQIDNFITEIHLTLMLKTN